MVENKKIKSFPNRLKLLIENVTSGNISAFAKKAGLNESTIRACLQGRFPTLAKLARMAVAGNVTVGWLAAGEGEETQYGRVPGPDEPAPPLITGEQNNDYKTILHKLLQEPKIGDENLKLIIKWLLTTYRGDVSQQLLLVNSLQELFPTFKNFLEGDGSPKKKDQIKSNSA